MSTSSYVWSRSSRGSEVKFVGSLGDETMLTEGLVVGAMPGCMVEWVISIDGVDCWLGMVLFCDTKKLHIETCEGR